jgi:hypothetical protein
MTVTIPSIHKKSLSNIFIQPPKPRFEKLALFQKLSYKILKMNNAQRTFHQPQPAKATATATATGAATSDQREILVDKLNGALSNLRRERDETHRSKDLALERLRLATEEKMSLEQTLKGMQLKYDELLSSMANQGASSGGDDNKVDDDMLKLQQEVNHCTREVSLDHTGTTRSYLSHVLHFDSSIAHLVSYFKG